MFELCVLNLGVILFKLKIYFVVCFDGLGMMYYFIDYLSVVSVDWKCIYGIKLIINWLVGFIVVKGSGDVVKVV